MKRGLHQTMLSCGVADMLAIMTIMQALSSPVAYRLLELKDRVGVTASVRPPAVRVEQHAGAV